jgi:hypothetical protein
VSSKKVLIMPSPQPAPENEPQKSEGLPLAPGSPIPLNDSRNLAATIDIFRTLGGIVVLEATTKSHTEKIEQLTQWVSAIPNLEKDVAQNTKDLNELGKRHDKDLNELGKRLERDVNELGKRHDKDISDLRNIAHTASTLGKIAVGILTPVAATVIIAVLLYIYHIVERLLLLAK